MKTVGFNTSPMRTGHSVRGIGFYAKNLLQELKKQASTHDIEIVEIESASAIPENVDLVHYPYFDLFTDSLNVSSLIKTVVTVHDVIPLEFPDVYPPGVKGSINLFFQKNSIQNVDRVITDSQASAKAIRKHLGVPLEKIKLVYLAPSAHFRPIKDKKILDKIKLKYKLPEKFVLYVGDVNWSKNIPSLVKACKLANLNLVIVGKQAVELERLVSESPTGIKDIARKLFGIAHPELAHLQELSRLFNSHSVTRLGYVSDDDLVAIYNLATLYCQPSYAEGFGLPVLEALACDTPVACSKTHSLPEIGGNAVEYFDPHNIDEIGRCLKANTKKSRVLQASKFSWAKTARETLMIYEEVMR